MTSFNQYNMRSLRSTRKVETSNKPTENKQRDENSSTKMCQKQHKSTNVTTKSTRRPVLADKTNSASDVNESSSPVDNGTNALKTRPKRNHQLPTRLLDHELSPILIRNKGKPKYSSTPLSIKPGKPKVTQSKRNKNSSNAKDLTALLTNESAMLDERRTEAYVRNENSPETINTKINIRSKKALPAPVLEIPVVSTSTSKYSFINRSKTSDSSAVLNAKKYNRTLSEHNVASEKIVPNPTPIYKSKLSLGTSNRRSVDRLALYEFEPDPTESPTKPKKKQARKKASTRKKKQTSSKVDDAAMKSLIDQLKKIQAAALLKKLAAKKKIMQNTLSVTQNVFPPPIKPVETILDEQVSKKMQDQFFQNSQPSTSFNQNPVPNQCMLSLMPLSSPGGSVYADDLPDNDSHEVAESNFSMDPAHKSSFFTDMPVASSSMINHGEPKPAASPWRVNYNNEQKKWPYNFHVKASMTPSYQRDTLHILGLDDKNDIEERGVRQDGNDYRKNENFMQHINESSEVAKNLKQTSILSFYEESLKKATKKTAPKTSTEHYSYEEYLASLTKKSSKNNSSNDETSPNNTKLLSSVALPQNTQTETAKEKPALENCFGFDDSDEIDQENISPVGAPKLKHINMIRGGGLKARAKKPVLKERNQILTGPSRVNTRQALTAIIKESHIEKEIEKELMEIIVEKESTFSSDSSSSNREEELTPETSGMLESENTENNIALFEDLAEPEFVHFNKPSRRSYEIRKRPNVKFNIEANSGDEHSHGEDSDDSLNPTFTSHRAKKSMKKTVKRKKNLKSKKEDKEADDWAAGFNSMLEEVDEFALCIE